MNFDVQGLFLEFLFGPKQLDVVSIDPLYLTPPGLTPIPLPGISDSLPEVLSDERENLDVIGDPDDSCVKGIKYALLDPKVADYLLQIQLNAQCKPLTILCACCKGKRAAGGWFFGKEGLGTIVICKGRGMGKRNISGTLVHELTHYLQDCEKRLQGDCNRAFWNEVEANIKQGMSCSDVVNRSLKSLALMDKCKGHVISEEMKAAAKTMCKNNKFEKRNDY